jgi:hypothetical protein
MRLLFLQMEPHYTTLNLNEVALNEPLGAVYGYGSMGDVWRLAAAARSARVPGGEYGVRQEALVG